MMKKKVFFCHTYPIIKFNLLIANQQLFNFSLHNELHTCICYSHALTNPEQQLNVENVIFTCFHTFSIHGTKYIQLKL